MENKSNKKELKKVTAKTLIEKGKKQGSLTLAGVDPRIDLTKGE